ncbi:MAG: two-component system NtrC family sensor kinase, partial [Cyclobacteriaceae bacterium]
QYQANMAQYFLLVNQPDSALFYANELAQTKTRLDGITNYDFVEATLKGYAYAQLNNPKKSDENFKKALLLSNSVESSSTSLLFYNSYIPFLFDNDRIEEARFLAKNLFKLGIKNKNNNIKLVAAGFLRQVFDAMHQIDSAYYYSQQEAVINAEIFSQNNVNRIQALAFNDQLRKIEEKSKEDSYQNRLRINAFLGSTFTLIVIAFFLFRNNRHKSKSKLKIEKAYDQLKSTQAQLIHSEKLASLGELTAGIAHEIQNPLNFVNNFSDLNKELLDELKDAVAKNDQEEVDALIKDLGDNESKINRHGRRAEAIVKSMLQHSRTGSGEKELTDINLLADEYLRLSYHGLRAKIAGFNADFKTDLDPDLPKINVVPQDIGRVLLNLINNAFQAVHEKSMKAESRYKPTVTLTTELTANGQLQIAIIDNGPGIPDSIKDKIFQPFFTTKPTGEGTGLGLSMSYDIVTKGHGGDLKVNTLKEEGSEFIIYLPTNK